MKFFQIISLVSVTISLSLLLLLMCTNKRVNAFPISPTNIVTKLLDKYYFVKNSQPGMDKPGVMMAIKQTLEKVKKRYADEQRAIDEGRCPIGIYNNDIDSKGDNLLLSKILLEELRNLRIQIENDHSKKLVKNIVDSAHLGDEFKKFEQEQNKIHDNNDESVGSNYLHSLSNLNCLGKRKRNEKHLQPYENELIEHIDDLDESQLMTLDEALDKADDLDLEELGLSWRSFQNIDKQKFISNAQIAFYDLIQNEVRTLALAIITAYFGGGDLAIMVTVSSAIRVKLLSFVVKEVFDFIADMMGVPSNTANNNNILPSQDQSKSQMIQNLSPQSAPKENVNFIYAI